jgi:hypothetical protein
MKIYIAGKITGLDIGVAEDTFQIIEDVLSVKGHQVVNPIKLPHNHDKSWQSYMKECLTAMLTCDAIAALHSAMDSKGATVEITLARVLDIPVYLSIGDIPRPITLNNGQTMMTGTDNEGYRFVEVLP